MASPISKNENPVNPFVWDDGNKRWVALQGNSSGSSFTSSVPFAQRYDDAGSGIRYYGEAVPGSLTSAAVWKISRMDISADPDFTITWADGNGNFDNIWDNRAALSYS